MSSDTAPEWFLPNAKWNALTEDYALVNYPASEARDMIDEANVDSRLQMEGVKSPCECFDGKEGDRLRCYAFEFMPRQAEQAYVLIYADVDDTNAEHKQMLLQRARSEELLEEEETCYAAIREDFINSLHEDPVERLMKRKSFELHDQKQKRETMEFSNNLFRGERRIKVEATDFLLKLESAEDRQRFLHIISGKTRLKHKRPQMLLIRMIATEPTSWPDSTGGYAIAFDVLENKLIIKSYYCDGNTHPLTSAWKTAVEKDGINFYGTPLEFAHKFIRGLTEYRGQIIYTRLLVHAHAAKFLLDHWAALFRSVISREEASALEDEVRKIDAERTPMIKNYKFIIKRKDRVAERDILGYFVEIRNSFLLEEGELRFKAIEAKNGGKEKVAKNAAKVYERLLSTVNAFLEDPHREL